MKTIIRNAEEVLEVTYATANNLIADLANLKILHEKTGHSRNRLFELKDYVTIFKK